MGRLPGPSAPGGPPPPPSGAPDRGFPLPFALRARLLVEAPFAQLRVEPGPLHLALEAPKRALQVLSFLDHDFQTDLPFLMSPGRRSARCSDAFPTGSGRQSTRFPVLPESPVPPNGERARTREARQWLGTRVPARPTHVPGCRAARSAAIGRTRATPPALVGGRPVGSAGGDGGRGTPRIRPPPLRRRFRAPPRPRRADRRRLPAWALALPRPGAVGFPRRPLPGRGFPTIPA